MVDSATACPSRPINPPWQWYDSVAATEAGGMYRESIRCVETVTYRILVLVDQWCVAA